MIKERTYTIAIIDNSNFCDYPTGGQLSSILNFLNHVSNLNEKNILIKLIGITREKCELKILKTLSISNMNFEFLPVAYDNNDPNAPSKSARKNFLLGIIQSIKLIRNLKIDIFYIHSPEAYIPLKLLFPFKKYVVFSHGNFYSTFDNIRFKKYKTTFLKLIVNKVFDFIIKSSNLVFVLDRYTFDLYRKSTKKVELVHNSIDTIKFKKDFHSNNKEINIIYVGRLSENKQIDKVIDAMYKSEDRFKLKIIGDGEESNNLEAKINNLKLNNRVQLIGKKTQSQIVAFYKNADILILNSKKEGLPMVVLEAMATGLCILATPVGAIPEILKDGKNGYFIDGTSDDIVKKLNLASEKLDEIYRNNIIDSQKFDFKVVNNRIIGSIQRICESI